MEGVTVPGSNSEHRKHSGRMPDLPTARKPPSPPAINGTPLWFLDSSHGLGSNQIHRIARDRDCRIWMAGPVGLSRFDGSFIREWDRRTGLQCNGLRSVAIDRDGNVWIGTDLGFEILDATGKPLPCEEPGAWRFGLCQHIDVSGRDRWIGTAHGLVKLEGREQSSGYHVAFSADIGFVSEVACLGEQRTFAASAVGGLVETDGKTWWRYRCEGLMDRQITRIALGRNGELLVGTDDGLYVVDDSSRAVRARLKPTQGAPVVTAIAVGMDRYWAAFGRTLVAFANDADTPHAVEHIRVDSPANDLLIDDLGNVFIATNSNGLAMLSCLRHAVQKIDVGLDGGIYAIKPGAAGNLTIGGENIFGNTAAPTDEPRVRLEGRDGLPDAIVWDTLEDETGIWAATQAGLYHAPTDGAGAPFAQVFAHDPILGAPNRVLLRRGEQLWAGSLRGLACIRDGTTVSVDADGTPLGYVYAMHLDDRSALWIGTLGRGLWREPHGRGLWREQHGLESIAVGPLSSVGNTYAVAQGPDGKMIVLQDEKVVLLDRDLNARVVTELPPVSGWTVAWIDARTVAIGGSDGLRILDIESGHVTRHVQSLFKLPDWEFTNNRTLVRDREGRFLCGLNGGLVRLDLAQLQTYAPPECRLTDVVWHHVEPEYVDNVARLRPGRWSFRLRVFSAWFVESERVRYQFKLVGFDDAWSLPQDRPEVTFTSLPPGAYRLLCRACSPLTGHGPGAEMLRMEVKRPLWAMGWSAVLATFESYYDQLVRSRTRNETLLEENRALEIFNDASTQSLRLANRQLEASRDAYILLAEVDELTQLGNRRNFEKELGRAMALTRRLKVPLALLMIDIDDFKMVNDRHGHQTGDDYLRAVGKVLAAATRLGEDVATRFGGEEFAILLLNTDTDGAIANGERIRSNVAALALPNAGSPNGILTVSIGVAALQPDTPMTREELVTRADRALYRAKNNGRNCVSP